MRIAMPWRTGTGEIRRNLWALRRETLVQHQQVWQLYHKLLALIRGWIINIYHKLIHSFPFTSHEFSIALSCPVVIREKLRNRYSASIINIFPIMKRISPYLMPPNRELVVIIGLPSSHHNFWARARQQHNLTKHNCRIETYANDKARRGWPGIWVYFALTQHRCDERSSTAGGAIE